MQTISTRQREMLNILLQSQEPITVQDLGVKLGVSRRTVFRELEHIDVLLRTYKLKIDTVIGKGIVLKGGGEDRDRLSELLKNDRQPGPPGRQRRQKQLILLLLRAGETQKLLYYANLLGVSEATISNDLDKIAEWFKSHNLLLTRKQSFGVSIEGGEEEYRRAFMAILQTLQREGLKWQSYIDKTIIDNLHQLAPKLDQICAWMTPESREDIFFYLLVTVWRILKGHTIASRACSQTYREQAIRIYALLETVFGIDFNEDEVTALSLELSACRNNAVVIPPDEQVYDQALQRLACQMIEAFDPHYSSILKLDEDLLRGLMYHLRSTLVRLNNHIELIDPLLEQITENYPDLMIKSTQAARVITGENGWLPDSEISFLAVHFGAAMHRLEARGIRKRPAKVGIVCLHGIGASYILAAQVRKHFSAEARVEVTGYDNPHEWDRYDVLISTVHLENAKVPVITVTPFLDEKSILLIREKLNSYTSHENQHPEREADNHSFAIQFNQLNQLCSDIQSLLEQFSCISIEADCTFEQLVRLAGSAFGDNEEAGKKIYEGLSAREQVSSQIIAEMELVLLHCRTSGVSRPLFALILPDGSRFTNGYFHQARACVLMLMPLKVPKESLELMGSVSSALIERREFISAILYHNRKSVYDNLEEILQIYLQKFINSNWKG